MGIHGLSKFLRDRCPQAFSQKSLVMFRGTRVGIDVSIVAYRVLHNVHKSAIEIEGLNEDKRFSLWLAGFTEMLAECVTFGVTPVMVFDGKSHLDKGATQAKRRELREATRTTLLELEARWFATPILDRTTAQLAELNVARGKNVELPPSYLKRLFTIFSAIGVPTFQATGEADRLLAALMIEGRVAAISSTDSDLLLHGVEQLINKWPAFYDHGTPMVEVINLTTVLQHLNLSLTELIAMGILNGTDYNEGIPRVGITTAYRLIEQGLPDRVNDRPFDELAAHFKYIPTTEQTQKCNSLNFDIETFKSNVVDQLLNVAHDGGQWTSMVDRIDQLPEPYVEAKPNPIKKYTLVKV